ncbi:low molecular weight protein arginine phosphatase [Proteinivorax tanatarense]|uniref:Low molecular weight protein arginine phosphatase n=1 Tax=Proteinivorax tanatarense TaxID=1260629 RepID=A0AAU7VL74_9FIRM
MILLVCTGNTCRSPLAAAYLDSITGEDVQVLSAGLMAFDDMPASEYSKKVAEEAGLDISKHKSKQVTQNLVKSAGLILTMTKAHKNTLLNTFPESKGKVYTLKEHSMLYNKDKRTSKSYDITDPFGRTKEEYMECFQEIKESLQHLGKK